MKGSAVRVRASALCAGVPADGTSCCLSKARTAHTASDVLSLRTLRGAARVHADAGLSGLSLRAQGWEGRFSSKRRAHSVFSRLHLGGRQHPGHWLFPRGGWWRVSGRGPRRCRRRRPTVRVLRRSGAGCCRTGRAAFGRYRSKCRARSREGRSWVGERRRPVGTDCWARSLDLGLTACVSVGEAVNPEGGVVGVSALEEGDPGVCDCEEGAADRVWVSRAGVEVGAFDEQAWVRSGVAQSSELCPESVAAE